MEIEKSLLSGSTPMLILALLEGKDMYGYEMTAELSRRSDDTFHLKEGTLYPLLHTLEKNRLISSYTTETPQGRQRKYYRLTEDGRRYLGEKKAQWRLFSEKVDMVLGRAMG